MVKEHIILFSENNYDIINKTKNYIGENSKVDHLYPYRTQKLSTLTPTIAAMSK